MIVHVQKIGLRFSTASKREVVQKMSRVNIRLCLRLAAEPCSQSPLLNASFGLFNNRKIAINWRKTVEGPPEWSGSGALALWGDPGEETSLGGPDRTPRCLQGGFLKRWTQGLHSGVDVFPIRPEPEWQLQYSTAWQAGLRNKVIVCKGAFNGNIRRIITSSEMSFWKSLIKFLIQVVSKYYWKQMLKHICIYKYD